MSYQDYGCISVLMSVYNGAATLEQAVGSILNQSYQNLELIICDDASTDGTWELLQEYEQKDSRIRLLRNTRNLGAGGARNRCLEQARGRYIALMDADDVSMPSRLEMQAAALKNAPELSFVGSRGRFFTKQPGDQEKCYWYVARPRKKDFLMTLPYVHASLMFRAEVLRELGGYSDKAYVKRTEDYDLLMRAYAGGCCGINLPNLLYGVRIDEETYRRRKYRYRFYECAVKLVGFSRMGLMPWALPYAIKPLIVGLLPNGLLNDLKEKYYGKREDPHGV